LRKIIAERGKIKLVEEANGRGGEDD